MWFLMATPPRVLDRHHKEANELDDLLKQHVCDAEESLTRKVCVCVCVCVCVRVCVCV